MIKCSNHIPRLSVIIPVYNREYCIAEAIDSVRRQTFSDWELILVDDGSTDKSGAICDSYRIRDSRIKVIHTENFGVSHARNVGLDHAEGEWLAFLDSDDEYLPNAFETLFAYSTDVDIVLAEYLILPRFLFDCTPVVEPISFHTQSAESEEMLLNYMYNAVRAKLFRREVFGHRFDETMPKCEDMAYCIDAVSAAHRIAYVPQAVLLYHTGSALSLSDSFTLADLRCNRMIYDKAVSTFNQDNARRWAGSYFIGSCIAFFVNIVAMGSLSKITRQLLIETYYDESIDPAIKNIIHNPLTAERERVWKAICTGQSSVIFDTVEENLNYFVKPEKQISIDTEAAEIGTFTVCLAGLKIEIAHKYPLIKEMCAEYIVQNHSCPDIVVHSSHERNVFSQKWRLEYDHENIGLEYAEYDAVPYLFYGELPKFDAFWLHSVVIEKDGVGYAFSADPGTGKSTHAALWMKAFPDAHIINGDNPIIRLNPEDGCFYAYGTPFCGKEGYHQNKGVLLKAVCFLRRGAENEIHRVRSENVLGRLMKDNFCIRAENGEAHFNLYKKFIEKTEFYSLVCNMDMDAAMVSYQGMTQSNKG